MSSRRYAQGPVGMTRIQRTVWNRHLWQYRMMCWRNVWYRRVRPKLRIPATAVFWLVFGVGAARIVDHLLDLV